ncbi:MAG: TonB-dependent receptor family protein, partial [Candidatus Binatia bacterium]
LEVSRYDLQFSLQHFFTENIELLTNIYYWNARRDWNRQDFKRNIDFAPPPDNTAATLGDTGIDGGAIFLQSSFGARDRDFQGTGIEPRLIIDYQAFGKKHHLHTGLRFHFEEMIDERNNRATLISDPVTRNRDIRKAYAFAFFFQNTLRVTDRLSVIPGFRLEQYTQTRRITREANMDVDIGNSSSNTVPIPGLGITFQAPAQTTLFTGIHRGFAPARTAQAISSDGEDLDLKPEFSWNFEAGVRTNPVPWWSSETTFFLLDFTNQVVPANESGGASTADTNAGKTRHLGVEFASALDILGMAGLEGSHLLYLDTRYTFVDTKNTTPGGIFEGKDLPYAPRHMAMVGMRYSGKAGPPKGLDIGIEGLFTSSQFADQANTVLPSNDGTIGEIPSYWLLNAYARYKVPKTRLEVNVVANNLLNNTYVVS